MFPIRTDRKSGMLFRMRHRTMSYDLRKPRYSISLSSPKKVSRLWTCGALWWQAPFSAFFKIPAFLLMLANSSNYDFYEVEGAVSSETYHKFVGPAVDL